MPGYANDNLAVLLEPDDDEVAEELWQRFKKGILYASLGDGIVSLNPQTSNIIKENSPENGLRYCAKRHTPNLPAHVYGLAHSVYKDATSMPQVGGHSIFISGIAGSGKTEISEMLISQFLREAGSSLQDDIPFVLMRGLGALKRVLTCKSASGPTSNTASVVVTLYFKQTGRLRTAKVSLHLLNARHAIPHTQGRGHLNIFYDLVAALKTTAPGLSVIENVHKILQSMDPVLAQLNNEALAHHRDIWLDFIEIIKDLNIGEEVPLGRQGNANSFLDSLLGLLLLATTQFDLDQHTRQYRLKNEENFNAAAQLLGVSTPALYDAVMRGAPNSDGLPPLSPAQSCDQLVHELYSRLVTWFIGEINSKLPDVESEDIPVHLADLQPFLDHQDGSLEEMCHNMAAEYIQVLQNRAVFGRESEACKAEGLKESVVKRQRCEDIVEFAFTTPGGLLNQFETLCDNMTVTDKMLVKTLNAAFKKRKDLYIYSKPSATSSFSVVHSHKQVMYHVDPYFRHQNLIIPNRAAQKLLIASRNVTVQSMFEQAIRELSSPNLKSHFSYITYIRAQLNALKSQVFGGVPHFVRCMKPMPVGAALDASFLKVQVQSACLPETIQQKRFGYTHWIPIPDFLKRYKMLDMSLLLSGSTSQEACKAVLKKVDILGKGVDVTKKYVFLRYWQKEKLDSLAEALVWKVTLVQAWFRGRLTRKRLHEVVAAKLRLRDNVFSIRRDGNSSAIPADVSQYDKAGESYLFERMIQKVLTRINKLSASTWAKVIYLEQGRELSKVYAAELSLQVSGSYEPFDGLELGLSYFHTPDRLEETEYIVANLDEGIELRRDSQGSILAKRNCQLPVCVKLSHNQASLSADVLRTKGELPFGHFIKIFDMQEFYSYVSLEMQKPDYSKASLQRSCITVVTFGSSLNQQFPWIPCWIAVININALNVLNDVKELQSISLITQQHILTDDKKDNKTKEEQEEAKLRRQRKRWSKSDQRPQLKKKEANSRNIREELRKRGENISDHMKYSWEEEIVSKAGILNMDYMYERMGRESSVHSASSSSSQEGARPSTAPVKDWAKVNVALRDALRKLQRAETEETIKVNPKSL